MYIELYTIPLSGFLVIIWSYLSQYYNCVFSTAHSDTPMQQYMSVFSQNGSSGYLQRSKVKLYSSNNCTSIYAALYFLLIFSCVHMHVEPGREFQAISPRGRACYYGDHAHSKKGVYNFLYLYNHHKNRLHNIYMHA